MRGTLPGGSIPINCVSNRVADPVAINSLSFADFASATIELDGSRPLLILLSYLARNDTAAARSYTARVALNGNPASAEMPFKLPKNVEAGEMVPGTFHFFTDAIPPGTHALAMQIKSDSEDAGQDIRECRMTVIEF
jgi:hypothetical protein